MHSVCVIYIKEAAASGIAKNEKRPAHEPEESGTHTRAFYFAGGWGLYAENLLLLQVLIEMICSDFFIISEFSPFEKDGSEGKRPYTLVSQPLRIKQKEISTK